MHKPTPPQSPAAKPHSRHERRSLPSAITHGNQADLGKKNFLKAFIYDEENQSSAILYHKDYEYAFGFDLFEFNKKIHAVREALAKIGLSEAEITAAIAGLRSAHSKPHPNLKTAASEITSAFDAPSGKRPQSEIRPEESNDYSLQGGHKIAAIPKTKNNMEMEIYLPPAPEGLEWPNEEFKNSKEFRKHGGICRHLERVWLPFIKEGAINMALLRNFYPSTADAIDDYKHRGLRSGGEPRRLPAEIDIPLAQAGSGPRRKAHQTANRPSIKA